MAEDSSEEEEEEETTKKVMTEKEEHIGKIVCVESTDSKKKGPKENWFPALVVAPTAQDTVRIRIKDEYLVRSFKDGRYYTVPKKEATEFTREQAAKQDTAAVQAALEYMHNDRLPTHWDREALFGLGNSSSDFYNEFDSDSSDDEPTEEKDHFVAQLYKYMDDRGTPLNKGPSIVNKDVDLYRLYRAVQKLGGYNRVTTQNQWKQIANRLGFVPTTNSIQNLVKQAYKKFLLPFEEFDRKLGCTMVAHPRANRIKGRSLLRANSVASPKPEKEPKSATSAAEESENTSESSIDNSRTKPKASTSSAGKVKTIIEKFEEKTDIEIKKEPKEIKEKEIKKEKVAIPDVTPAASTRTTKNIKKEKEEPVVEKTPSTKKEEPVVSTPQSKREKIPKKPATPQTDDKKSKKRTKEAEPPIKPIEKDKEKVTDQNDFPINVGDKLKVYYHEQKVTYEAKVIEISKQVENALYLVHYTGWNTRYDEWVPKERVAENLTNNKTNKNAKKSGKSETRSNSAASEKIAGPSSIIKASIKRSRGSSRGESQPPRSTTPSSVASNSSRTKSPATPAQRRTTRGQPNALRRTSNNTDISSLQTDSESDSDEPVKKPTPKRKATLAKANQLARNASSVTVSEKKDNSNPSSEEETLANTKGRDFDLNEIRSELKGFKDLKTPASPEGEGEPGAEPKKKFDFPGGKATVKTEFEATTSGEQSKTNSENKTSSDNSSETDSYGDEDSQFSDKTTTLDNISEKFQKYVYNKAPTAAVSRSDLVEKVATLKASGIEKIIKNSLADKSKALPEKMSMKVLCERSPVKLEKEKEKEREREREEKEKVAANEKLKTEEIVDVKAVIEEKSVATLVAEAPSTSSASEPAATVIKTEPVEPKGATKLSYLEKPILQNLQKSPAAKVGPKPAAPKQVLKEEPPTTPEPELKQQQQQQSTSSSNTCDIYEFKEPEPFEFETAKKPSPEIEKKSKRKTVTDKPESSKSAAAKRAKKNMRELEKIKDIKLEDDEPMPTSPISSPILTPPKVESIFDSLRKSPSFNLNLAGGLGDGEQPSTSSAEMKPLDAAPITIPHPAPRPLFISSFVEAKREENVSTVFDIAAVADDIKEELDKVESSKKILLTEEVLNLEPPPKVDKPSSIADKVLKALHSQQQHSPRTEKDICEPSTSTATAKEPSEPPPSTSCDTTPDVKEKDLTPIIPAEPTPPAVQSSSAVELPTPAVISKDIETPPTKPVLSSPEHKIDILESIAPKNNDLSETIQKLESVIQKTSELTHISEDSSDSTDSEQQRLVIEDESQSSETQNEFTLGQQPPKKEVEVPLGAPLKTTDAIAKTVEPTVVVVVKSETNTTELLLLSPKAETLPVVTKSSEAIAGTSSSSSSSSLIVAPCMDVIKSEPEECVRKDDALVDNTQNESISLLLCEETIPGSPAPVCPKEICENNKKSYDSIFASPHPTGSDTKPVPMDIEPGEAKPKNETATPPSSSPRDSMSQDDSSEENQKKQGWCFHILIHFLWFDQSNLQETR